MSVILYRFYGNSEYRVYAKTIADTNVQNLARLLFVFLYSLGTCFQKI